MTNNGGSDRFVMRQMCNLSDPDNLASWLLIDRRTGIPLGDGREILTFTKEDARKELSRRNGKAG